MTVTYLKRHLLNTIHTNKFLISSLAFILFALLSIGFRLFLLFLLLQSLCGLLLQLFSELRRLFMSSFVFHKYPIRQVDPDKAFNCCLSPFRELFDSYLIASFRIADRSEKAVEMQYQFEGFFYLNSYHADAWNVDGSLRTSILRLHIFSRCRRVGQ